MKPAFIAAVKPAFIAAIKPAFITAMVAQGPPPSSPRRASKRCPPAHSKRRRVALSELTRKYRANARDADESLLVGGPPAFDPQQRHQQPSPPPHQQPQPQPQPQPQQPLRPAQSTALRSAINYSRFPTSWQDTVAQLTNAITVAAASGHDRIRAHVKNPHLMYSADRVAGVPVHNLSHPNASLARLVECACAILKHYLPQNADARTKPLLFTPRRACIFFNSEHDAAIGRQFIHPSLEHFAEVLVLDQTTSYNLKSTVSVVIAPTNRQGNPSHIEAVERVHYCNWNDHKLVVLLNPDLVALTCFSSFGNQPRQPCFLGDYLLSYYLDPVAYPAKAATGAVLRCFPRKWEMYLLKVHSRMGFRLIAEHKSPPSPEKLRCEFSWRVESDADEQQAQRRAPDHI